MPMRWTSRFGLALLIMAPLVGMPVRVTAQARSPQLLARLADSVNAAGGRVIIVLKSSNLQARLMAPGSNPLSDTEFGQIRTRLESAPGLTVSQTSPMIGALFARVDATRLAALNADTNVAMMEADRVVYLQSTPTDRRAYPRPALADAVGSERLRSRSQALPWGITQVTAPVAWALGFRGTGVKVGIMDSGGDPTHPDLGYAGGYNAVTGGTNPSDWTDDIPSCNGHGTHVAGTIAARDNTIGVVGVAPEASIYAIKVFEDLSGGCGAWISTQITAVNWAANNGIRVINASIGGSWSYSYQLAIDQAAVRGTFLVAAAGNDNGGPVDFPAAFPSAIAAASLSASNTRSSFSNAGPEIEVGAPGENVESTMPGGGYGSKSGTSMATPHVTGVVALLVQQNPNITLTQVRQELQNGALDIATPGFDNNTGWGLVRASNSLSGGSGSPLTLTLAPVSRNVAVTQGNSAPSDNATVTLSGTNAASTAWSATKKKAWTTLTTSSGTGSGTVAWSRNANGLAVGTYVDTITVSAAGAAGSPGVVYDTLRITAPPPLVLAVSPGSRNVAVQQGSAAPADNATVTLSGTGAASAVWTATKKKAWTTFTTAGGTGSGAVAWSRNATGLAVGTYVDTITVSAIGATGSPDLVFDTLRITAAPPPLVLAVSPGSRNVAVQQGSAAPSDNATVTLSGTGAASAVWTATKRKAWTTLTTAGGTGSGTVAWSRNATGLAVGTYVDTITVSAIGATGSPDLVFDTLRITAAPPPLVLAVSPGSRNVAVQQGSAAPSDNATVTLSGTGAASAVWTATKRKAWTTLTTAGGTGSGTVAWSRNATGLAVGTYVDTITVSAVGATGSPDLVFDTLRITAPPPVVLAISPTSRNVAVQQGSAAPSDNATVTLTGVNAATATWAATKKKAWTTLTTASGTGSGTLAWSRSATGLAVGTYIDTITVTSVGATGSPGVVYDTLRITAPPIPVVLAVTPAGRAVSVQQGNSAPPDNATVTLTGTNAASTAWTATKRKAWTTLTTASGTGSGTAAWSRSTTGLAVGTYVDTITVTALGAASGSPATVFDTLRITPIPVPVTLAVNPLGRAVSVQQGNPAPVDNATVTLAGTNAATTAWIATNKRAWNTLTTANGTGSGTVRWSRNATGLAVGTYVDTITVTAPAAIGSPIMVFDTLRITPIPVPVTLAVSPLGRAVSVQQGNPAPVDNATVTLAGTNAATTAWIATNKQAWNTLTTANGTGSGTVRWSRNATGLAVGTYVDTITVTAPAAVGSPIMVFDTLRITAPVVPIVLAVVPASHNVALQQGSAPAGDNATVVLTGTNAAATTWSATKRKSWTTLTTASGTGTGLVAWSRDPAGLAVGTYVDTITVTAPGAASGSPARIIDTLRITAASVPIVLAVSPASRNVVIQQGNAAPGDNATVTLTGTGAASTAWNATKKQSWTTLVTASGTGSGSVSWTRNASGLVAGTYVDTITVAAPGAASGSPDLIVDTLRITAPPIPIVLAVSPASLSITVQQGVAAPSGNATVTLTGTNASSAAWIAVESSSWTTLTTGSGTGNGTVSWTRNAAALAVGTYVDTITVTAPSAASGTPARIIDTLRITAAPVSIVLAVSPTSRSVAVQQGDAAPGGNATVTLTGTNASSAAWIAVETGSWTTLTTGSGTGSGTVTWTRNAAALAVGTYVDTITVTAPGAVSGSPATIIDTLRITAASVPIVLAVSPAARSVAIQQGNAAPGDNATVTLTGTGAASTAWNATRKHSWTTLATAGGTGTGVLAWTRNVASLAVGTYVDTIVVTAPGAASGSPATIYDTVQIIPATVILAVRPGSKRSRKLTIGSSTAALELATDSAMVQLAGGGSLSDVWTATTAASRFQIVAAQGLVGTELVWQRLAVTLPAGLYVDTLHVQLQRDPAIRAEFIDTLEIVSVSLPDPAAAVADLFHANALTADQRTVLDIQGNNNGRFDIGDFLAWVDHDHLRLSAAVVARLQELSPLASPSSDRPRIKPIQ